MSDMPSSLKQLPARLLSAAAILLLPFVAVPSARAQTLTTLYRFTGYPNDGSLPSAGLTMDAQANLYGTTQWGGAGLCKNGIPGCGTVFKLTPNGTETLLYSFSTHRPPSAPRLADGAWPMAGLILDAQGNLYGTTDTGLDGSSILGIVFKLAPNGAEKVLHYFTGYPQDGAMPQAAFITDAQGNLYGTTAGGGPYLSSAGTVFKLSQKGIETQLYSFLGPPDGWSPVAGLVMDAQGNLYGTTVAGGTYWYAGGNNCGTVFKVTPDGTETVLYNFTGGADGDSPRAGLLLDAQGNLYGTTQEGGAYGGGTVFKLTPSGEQTVLYSFCSQAYCTDGAGPVAGLIADAQGNLYGTTSGGGGNCFSSSACQGTVFKLDPSGAETVLYRFCAQSNCADGSNPLAGLIMDAQGNLYGTTANGGNMNANCAYGGSNFGCGTVFKLTQ